MKCIRCGVVPPPPAGGLSTDGRAQLLDLTPVDPVLAQNCRDLLHKARRMTPQERLTQRLPDWLVPRIHGDMIVPLAPDELPEDCC